MSAAEERQAKSLAAIAEYMKQLIPIMRSMNQNLVDFAKIVQKSNEEPEAVPSGGE